jgi:glycosyltransferase involved in cell wall biosynthesis
MRVVAWGTYDTGKPRVRILLRGLRENGVELIECHREIWGGVEDKSRLAGRFVKLRIAWRWLVAYPVLVWRYLRLPRHDAVLVGYLGHLDVLVLWPFARLRRVPVVWDAFLSLYDTMVNDRKLLGPGNPLARVLRAWEWLACRAVNCVLLDTRAHADYFADCYNIPPDRMGNVHVGVEPEFFHPAGRTAGNGKEPPVILFYGQCIPLHGISIILQASQDAAGLPLHWILIGKGQEEGKIQNLLQDTSVKNVEWIPWVPYERLIEYIRRSDICLGIFGTSGKADRVIPNKVFQTIACAKPLITRDSSAIRELLSPDMPGVYLVKSGNSGALLAAIRQFIEERSDLALISLHAGAQEQIQPATIGKQLVSLLARIVPDNMPSGKINSGDSKS